jgi:hypothetical protein
MKNGILPADYIGQHYKRLWMLVMYLRRDLHVVKCLVKRALETAPYGKEASELWYNDSCFTPQECELPVDGRVLSAWCKFSFLAAEPPMVERIALEARQLARSAGVAPCSFDAILFFRSDKSAGPGHDCMEGRNGK